MTNIFSADAGSDVLRRAGFFDVQSGSSEYLRPGVGSCTARGRKRDILTGINRMDRIGNA